MLTNCPDCSSKLQAYFCQESGFTQYVCWKCGFYASNSPACQTNPSQFKDMIRKDPTIINRLLTRRRSTADLTEPKTRCCVIDET